MTSTAYKLQAEGIHKSYGSNHVLKGVTLTAKAGDVISLIGSSGSGKSTLLHLAGLLDRPDAGSVRIAGEAARRAFFAPPAPANDPHAAHRLAG